MTYTIAPKPAIKAPPATPQPAIQDVSLQMAQAAAHSASRTVVAPPPVQLQQVPGPPPYPPRQSQQGGIRPAGAPASECIDLTGTAHRNPWACDDDPYAGSIVIKPLRQAAAAPPLQLAAAAPPRQPAAAAPSRQPAAAAPPRQQRARSQPREAFEEQIDLLRPQNRPAGLEFRMFAFGLKNIFLDQKRPNRELWANSSLQQKLSLKILCALPAGYCFAPFSCEFHPSPPQKKNNTPAAALRNSFHTFVLKCPQVR